MGEFVIGLKDEQSYDAVLGRLKTMLSNVKGETGVRDQVLHEMGLLREYLEAMDVSQHVKIDTSLARGIDYYTGMIFEAVI